MAKYLTKEGLERLKKELEILKTVKRKDISKRIKEAASFGDLKENAAYTEAKEQQAFLEGRIQELEAELRSAKILEKGSGDKVEIGSKVLLFVNNEEENYIIVDPAEANLLENKISYLSPLGKELMNKKVGDSVKMNFDHNVVKYIIKNIK